MRQVSAVGAVGAVRPPIKKKKGKKRGKSVSKDEYRVENSQTEMVKVSSNLDGLNFDLQEGN